MIKYTAYADIELHPDGSKKPDGIAIVKKYEPNKENGLAGMIVSIEGRLYSDTDSEQVARITIEQAENLIKDLKLVIDYSKKLCK